MESHTQSETALFQMVMEIPAATLFESLPEICAEVESFWEYYGYTHTEYAVDMLEGEGIDENSDTWDILAAIVDNLLSQDAPFEEDPDYAVRAEFAAHMDKFKQVRPANNPAPALEIVA